MESSSSPFVPNNDGVDPRSLNKPNVLPEEAIRFIEEHYKLVVVTLSSLPSYDDLNFRFSTSDQQYVFKISNAFEKLENLDFQNKAICHLRDSGICVPELVLTAAGEGIATIIIKGARGATAAAGEREGEGQKLFVRVLSFLPGTLLADVPFNDVLCFNFGKLLGKMDLVFTKFSHPAAQRYMAWNLSNSKKVILAHLPVVKEPELQSLIQYYIDKYEKEVEPLLPNIRQSIIHGDPNDHNILISNNVVSGVLDFGDLVYTHVVNEISIACAYAMLGKPNPIDVASRMLAGYHSEFPLSQEESHSVFLLSCMRLCTSAVMGRYNISLQPENREYLEVHSKPAWEMLQKLRKLNWDDVNATMQKYISIK